MVEKSIARWGEHEGALRAGAWYLGRMQHSSIALLLSSLAFVACGSGGSSVSSDGGRDSSNAADSAKSSPDAGHDASGKPRKDAGPDSTTSDGGTDSGIPTGPPITATADKWTWVPFPDSSCANGTSTGIGVNLSGNPSSRVVIYLEGGGACWDELTCYTVMSAVNFATGYGATNFTADTAVLDVPGGFFDRATASNPFKDYSYVYIPYCTGDVHAGNNVVKFTGHTAHFVGYQNMGAYLARLVPTFSGADRIILAGSSAGGFGAALNWWRTQQAFGSIRVDLIDDSGTAMPDSALGDAGVSLEQTQGAAWNISVAFPPGCKACATDLSSLYGYYEKAFASHRAALLSYENDTVLPTFFGITEAQFTEGLNQDIGSYFGAGSSLKYFTNAGAGHTMWFTPTLTTGTTTVQQFITQMVTDDPSWASVHP
jgi:hypothetical protein